MLIFDFDGTIADTMEEALRIANELAPKYNLAVIDTATFEELRGLRTREIIKRIGIAPRVIPRFLAETKAEMRSSIDRIQPIDGMPETLKGIRNMNVRMGILTSNSSDNVEAFLRKWELTDCFEFLETGSSLFGKARLLRRLLEKVFVKGAAGRDQVVYVGDETRDINAAKRVGIKAAAVSWGANTRAILEEMSPDFVFDHPSELLDLAASLGKVKA